MQIIHHHLHGTPAPTVARIPIPATRETLAKRRWRGVAADGREFGFDLDHLLVHGDGVLLSLEAYYFIEQSVEPVLELPLAADPSTAAQVAWKIGNLHFPIEVTTKAIRVADDSAIRQMLEREHLTFHPTEAVFQPLSAVPHSHGAGHSHD